MAMTPTQIVSAVAASDKTAVVHVRSNKASFREILNDSRAVLNEYQQLDADPNGCVRVILVVDRLNDQPTSPAGDQLNLGGSVAVVARRL